MIIGACGGGEANTKQPAGNTNNRMADGLRFAVVGRPQKIADLMKERGEQDQAMPTLKILEPAANSTVTSSTVKVKVELAGDLKGYMPGMNEETHTGNHIHVILDNAPYEAYYDINKEFELQNVADGEHTLRVFPSRPWHESYKNEGAFQMIKFTVKGGGADAKQPATTNSGNTMSNANSAGNATDTPEGKDVQNGTDGNVDAKKPLLTYSRPKGEYKGEDAAAIMIDFWLKNAKLREDGGDFRVRYLVDTEARFIDKWEPIWITGLTEGKHRIAIDLIDGKGQLVENGGYNSTFREITITK
jgi:hypothetical protein